MFKQVLATTLISIGAGYACQLAQSLGQSDYLNKFLENNLITLLVALLAINSATMGIVLSKIRDIIDKNEGSASSFQSTKSEMLLSIKEQISLIAIAVALLTLGGSNLVQSSPDLARGYWVLLTAVFIYALMVLYDTAKGVIIILDYE